MSTAIQSRLRIAADLFQFEDFSDTLRSSVSGYIPKFRAGDDLRIELALFNNGSLLDISTVESLALEIKPIESEISESFDNDDEDDIDLRAPSNDVGLLLSKEVTSGDFYPGLTQMEWDSEAADKAHAVFELNANETQLAPGDRWLTISLLTSDTPALSRTVAAGRIRILGGGQSHA